MGTRINIFLILLILFSEYVIAKEYSEQSLRTLFTSPQERQEIDNYRQENRLSEEQIIARPSSVKINGVVKRSDGKNIVWINGKSTADNATIDSVKVYSKAINSKNKIPVMVDGQRIYLKPGETWSEESGVSGTGN